MQKTTPAPPGAPGRPTPQTPTPPPGAGPVAGTADPAALRVQLGDINVQLAALRAQWRGLQRQLESMRIDNPARPAVQQQAADVGIKIAQLEGDAARIQAQLGVLQGTTGQPVLPPRSRQFDPDLAAGLMFAFIFAVLMPISIAYARRVWRGRPNVSPTSDPTIAPRFDRLEHAIDAIAIEVERVSEGQRFVTKILAERPSPVSAAKGEHGDYGSAMRALGAGAAEPVSMPERETVRRNTPH